MASRPAERLRTEVRAAWRAAAWANRKLLAVIGLTWVVTTTTIRLAPLPGWYRGFLAGMALMVAMVLAGFVIFEASGARNQYFGQVGEQSTAGVIGGWRARGRGWKVVHNLYFQGHGDVDHVLFASGGVFAIETKAISASWDLVDGALVGPYAADALHQARMSAQKIGSLLNLGRTRLGVPVRAVLVIWGPGAPELEDGYVGIDGVLVCEGRQHRRWRKQLGGELRSVVSDAAFAMVVDQRESFARWVQEGGRGAAVV